MNQYEYLQGSYQISTAVNGEPSWKNGAYAIWFVLRLTTWVIGPLNRIGEDSAFIYANDADYGLTYSGNDWKFWNGNSHIHPSDPEDIHITCNGKHSKHLQLH